MTSCIHAAHGTRFGMTLTVELDREVDGRWIASVRELPGVHVYGTSSEEAVGKAQGLAFEVIGQEITNGERDPRDVKTVTFVVAQAA